MSTDNEQSMGIKDSNAREQTAALSPKAGPTAGGVAAPGVSLTEVMRDRDHLMTAWRTVRHLLPLAIDAPNMGVRYALEAADAILKRHGTPAPEPAAPAFLAWDIVANKFGPASAEGFPLRSGACQYADAFVASVNPFVLVSRDGAMVWTKITPEQRAHLIIVGHAKDGEEGPAALRLKADLFDALEQS